MKSPSRFLALLTLAPACVFAGDITTASDKSTTLLDTAGRLSLAQSDSLSEYFFGKNNAWDSAYDAIQEWKKTYHIPITIGANNWFHVDRNERIYGNGYGVPGERDTYYYFVDADPSYSFGDNAGFLKEIGAHAEFRFRDDNTKFRSFYAGTYWMYEAYGYAKTSIGDFKVGQIAREFGIPWDGTWWEGVPYFDGMKFVSDYGASWDNKWKFNDQFSMDTAAQYFFAESGVDGEEGATPEAVPGLNIHNMGVVRFVPTWKPNADTTIALGVSAMYSGISGSSKYPGTDSHWGAWGSDLSLTWKNWNLFGEIIETYGAVDPVNYVSGGPSNRVNSARVGLSYKYGPMTYHVNYSNGWDENPGGHQFVLDAGVTTQLTKNITFYAEYVRWDVTNAAGVTSKFDDGFELILVWKF